MESSFEILGDAPEWLQYIIAAVVALKLLTTMTPSKLDDKWFGYAYNPLMKLVNLAALNFGRARNADDPK